MGKKKTYVKPHTKTVNGKRVPVKGHYRDLEGKGKDGGFFSSLMGLTDVDPDELKDEYEDVKVNLGEQLDAEIEYLKEEKGQAKDVRDSNLKSMSEALRLGNITNKEFDKKAKQVYSDYQNDLERLNQNIDRLKKLKKYRMEQLKDEYRKKIDKHIEGNVPESMIPEPDYDKMDELEKEL